MKKKGGQKKDVLNEFQDDGFKCLALQLTASYGWDLAVVTVKPQLFFGFKVLNLCRWEEQGEEGIQVIR